MPHLFQGSAPSYLEIVKKLIDGPITLLVCWCFDYEKRDDAVVANAAADHVDPPSIRLYQVLAGLLGIAGSHLDFILRTIGKSGYQPGGHIKRVLPDLFAPRG